MADPMERLVRSLKDDLDAARAQLAAQQPDPDRLARALHDADCGCDTYDPEQDPRYLAAAVAALSGPAEPAGDEHAGISLHRPDGPRGSVDATCRCGAWATVLTDAEAREWWEEHRRAAVT